MTRRLALAILPVAALGSLACMFFVGRHNPSIIIMVLFAGWVLSPFVAFAWAERRCAEWSPRARTMLYVTMLLVALVSLAIYAAVVVLLPAKPAAMFLIVPFGSWLLMGIGMLIARRSPQQP